MLNTGPEIKRKVNKKLSQEMYKFIRLPLCIMSSSVTVWKLFDIILAFHQLTGQIPNFLNAKTVNSSVAAPILQYDQTYVKDIIRAVNTAKSFLQTPLNH